MNIYKILRNIIKRLIIHEGSYRLRRGAGAAISQADVASGFEETTQSVAEKNYPGKVISAETRGEHSLFQVGQLKLLLDNRSLVDQTIIKHGFWEKDQIEFLLNSVKYFRSPSQNIFLDVGSYFGLYSLKAAITGKFAEIHAFEADRHTIGQLYANVFLNDLCEKIKVHNIAVSKNRGVVVFRDSRADLDNRGGTGIVGVNSPPNYSNDHMHHYEMPCDRLDNLLSFNDKNLVIKLDVEWHERDVLLGMKRLISDNRVFIQAEAFEDTRSILFDTMAELGLNFIRTIKVDHYFANFECRVDQDAK